MGRYILKREYDDKEYYKDVMLVVEADDEEHISDVHRTLRSFARVLGYADKSVEEYFGEDCWND